MRGLVLVHGMGGRHWGLTVPKIIRGLVGEGTKVLVPKTGAFKSIENRSESLKEQIESWLAQENLESVNVIAHSMGGLDSRFLITKRQGSQYIRTLTTITTPHRGSCVADLFLDFIERPLFATKHLQSDKPVNLSRIFLPSDWIAQKQVTPKYCSQFNALVPDHPDVKYFSVLSDVTRSLPVYHPLRYSHQYISRREGPNDGLVSCYSSQWGQTLLTTNIDHISQLGWSLMHPLQPPAFNMFFQIIRSLRQLDHL